MHYTNMFYKSKNDSKKTWKQINDLISSCNQYKQHNYFKTNDSILTDHTYTHILRTLGLTLQKNSNC